MARRKTPPSAAGAYRRLASHPGEAAAIAAEQMLLRWAVLLPILLRGEIHRLLKLPEDAAFLVSLLLYVFLVLPLRFHGGEGLRALTASRARPRGGKPYLRWLVAGLARHGLSLLWGLPFLLSAGYFIYGWSNLPFPTMWQPVLAVSLPGTAALLLLFTLLLVYGWWRWLPVEYLPARHMKTRDALFFARRARKRGRAALIKNALVNCLLTLPAAAGFLLVMVPYVIRGMQGATGAQFLIANALKLLRAPLPKAQITQLLAVYFLLYLPLCLLRKTRNAMLVRRLTREADELENGHAAG